MTNSVLKIPVANFCCLMILQIYPGHDRCVASWKYMICGSNFSWNKVQNASETTSLCMKLLTLVYNNSVCSQTS